MQLDLYIQNEKRELIGRVSLEGIELQECVLFLAENRFCGLRLMQICVWR